MSTPNFYNKNASRVFASECQEEFDYNDLLDNVRSELKYFNKQERPDNDRSYPGTIFAEYNIESGKFMASINLIARSGYYSGVNLDWEVEIENQKTGDSFEMGEDKISATLQNLIDRKIKQIEKVYKIYTTPLICLGVFSNGEAIYEKAKN
jgi:hypothetical protein